MPDLFPDSPERWADRYEAAGPLERIGLLGGAAVRVTANAIDRVLNRAAGVVAEAEDAFKKEVDPNIVEAKILEERRGRESERGS